jgi:cyclase
MYIRPRVMPCLLLRNGGLVKTTKFTDARYLGDPVNTVRIFNDKEVDELVLLDITATTESKPIQFELVHEIVSEAFVPVCYGGGVRSLEDATRLLALGVEKISLNTSALEDLSLISAISERFGASTTVVSIDARRRRSRHEVATRNGSKTTGRNPAEWARAVVDAGAGEILINSVDRDGTMEGYDLELVGSIASEVTVPVIAAGGAGSLSDFAAAVDAGASACAAGAFFVFQGRHRAVLISFPSQDDLNTTFGMEPAPW